MKKYCGYIWLFVFLSFLGFIGIMSYWYPVTLDEYYRWDTPFVWESVKNITPRISFLVGIPIFYLGKWSFVLLNPLVQFVNCLCIFYIVLMHLPNTRELKDMPYFLIILCMSVFFVCRPSEVIFWISGAFNYSWMILPFLIMLCFLRQIYAQKFIFNDVLLIKICFFIVGFFVGMGNEALAPIALVFTVCFGLFCNFKNIKTPRALSFMIFGLAIGCLVFFSAPAHYNKMLIAGISNISAVNLWQKLFFHLSHFNDLFMAQFFLPVLTGLFLLIAAIDIRNRNLKTDSFCFSLIFYIFGFLTAFILFIVPRPPLRAYYPSSVSFMISFLFLVRYYTEVYKFDFARIICIAIITESLCLMPRFVYPHYYLHLQEKERNAILKQQSEKEIKPYIVLKGPSKNLSIGLMDPERRIDVGGGMYITDVSPLTNW